MTKSTLMRIANALAKHAKLGGAAIARVDATGRYPVLVSASGARLELTPATAKGILAHATAAVG